MDNVIGIEKEAPILNMLTGVKHHFGVTEKCKKIFQALLIESDGKKCISAKKFKAICELQITQIII